MIKRRELPLGWGLLECSRASLRKTSHHEEDDRRQMIDVRISVRAQERMSKPEFTSRFLRNIAAAATRSSLGMTAQFNEGIDRTNSANQARDEGHDEATRRVVLNPPLFNEPDVLSPRHTTIRQTSS
jgi:hypothetical protein